MNSDMNTSMHSRRLYMHCGPNGTPESEFNNFECFQNYTAPEVFIQGLAGIVNQGDVELMIRAQKQMLQRFEKTNEMLLNCNALSANRLKASGEEFKKHTKLLNEMKKDLDYIFRKIRNIKTKISVQYPTAFAEAEPQQRSSFAEEADEDDEVSNDNNVTGQDKKHISTKHKCKNGAHDTDAASVSQKPNVDKKLSLNSQYDTTFDYVPMEQQSSPDNNTDGLNIDNENAKRLSMESNKSAAATDNSNDSSDCTSDTG